MKTFDAWRYPDLAGVRIGPLWFQLWLTPWRPLSIRHHWRRPLSIPLGSGRGLTIAWGYR